MSEDNFSSKKEVEEHLNDCKSSAVGCLQVIHPIDAAEAIIEYLKSCHCSDYARQLVLTELISDGESKKLLNKLEKNKKYQIKLLLKIQELENQLSEFKIENKDK